MDCWTVKQKGKLEPKTTQEYKDDKNVRYIRIRSVSTQLFWATLCKLYKLENSSALFRSSFQALKKFVEKWRPWKCHY